MTKFLVGGYTHKGTDDGVAFWHELAAGFGDSVKILECLFARPRDTWEKLFIKDKEFAERSLPDKKLDIRLAQPETFIEQVRWADAIYLRGGDAEQLLAERPSKSLKSTKKVYLLLPCERGSLRCLSSRNSRPDTIFVF